MRSRSKVFGVLVLCAAVLVCGGAAVLADDGSLSAEAISKIRSGFTMDGHTRAMYNAITNTDVKSMALNRDLLLGHDEFFSKEIKVKDITSQKSSGRCWLFASLNSLRPYVIKKNELKTFEFSENYYTFWDKLEKANTFYERVIEFKDRDLMDRELVFVLRNPIPDGGYWENAKDLIQKYGAVPKGVMPETNSSNKTAAMNKVLAQKLRVDAVKLRKMNEAGKRVRQMRTAKEKMLSEVYRVLVINLGEPPVEFDWRYEKKSADEDMYWFSVNRTNPLYG